MWKGTVKNVLNQVVLNLQAIFYYNWEVHKTNPKMHIKVSNYIFLLLIVGFISSCDYSLGAIVPYDEEIPEMKEPPKTSMIKWPFQDVPSSDGWYITKGQGVGGHENSDHYALDYSRVPSETCFGKPFLAPFSGKTIYATEDKDNIGGYVGYGIQVIIQSTEDSTFAFRVAHLSRSDTWLGDLVEEVI